MNHRLLVINFSFGSLPKIAELEPVFTAIGDDWIRFSGLTWILWTNKPAIHVFTLLNPHLTGLDSMLITPFEGEDMFGNMPNWVWEWLKSKEPGKYNVGPHVVALANLPAEQLRQKK